MLKSIFSKVAPAMIRQEVKAGSRTVTEDERRLAEMCGMTAEEAMRGLGVLVERGLDSNTVEQRQEEYGRNEITTRKKVGPVREILRRCRNPLVIQLLVIAAVSVALGDYRAASVVGGMVILSVGLSYVQETRSSKAVEKLKAMIHTNVTVLREGKEQEIPLAELVPGDLVVLDAGALVPADLRILRAKDLFVAQSALTGESMPVEKTAAQVPTEGRGVLSLECAAFQGSSVVSGAGLGLVVNTGDRTSFGAISLKLSEIQTVTSFDKGIKDFTWLMVKFMVVMVCAVFLIIGITKHDWVEAMLFGLAVAVGLTPEMLPMIVTVNLSKGAISMAKKKVIVKRLSSIQNFGAIDILCTDKTGTLTQDRVVLEKHLDVTGRTSDDVLRYAYLNSFYQTGLRNLLDRAVLERADLDVERTCRKVDEIPFDFQRRRMSVTIEYEGDIVLICKGAVEEVLKACSRYQVDEDINPLIDVIKYDLLEEVELLSRDGFRVLAIAYREFPPDKQVFSVADESDLILLGYIAFFDPPKETAAQAIAGLRNAGVAVKILTGDNPLVTKKVCQDVGIDAESILTGDDLKDMTQGPTGPRGRASGRICAAVALTKRSLDRRPALQRPRGGLSGRRHQRRPLAEDRGCGHFRGYRRGCGQGSGRYRPAGEKPGGAGRRHDRGPSRVRQHHQVHPHGRQLEFRQHVQRGGRGLLPAVSAHGAHPDSGQQPAVRFFAGGHSHGQRG